MVLIIRSNRISRVPLYFSYTFITLNFDYRSFTFFARPSQNVRLSNVMLEYIRLLQFRSSLLSESLLLSFPHPTKIFQFGWSRLLFSMTCLLHAGFSHSDSSGSLLTYSSPKRFAVRRVLLRLLVPRHPLCALCSLTLQILIRFFFYLLFKDLFLFLRNYLSLSKLYTTNFCNF